MDRFIFFLFLLLLRLLSFHSNGINLNDRLSNLKYYSRFEIISSPILLSSSSSSLKMINKPSLLDSPNIDKKKKKKVSHSYTNLSNSTLLLPLSLSSAPIVPNISTTTDTFPQSHKNLESASTPPPITRSFDIFFTVYGEPMPLSRHMFANGRMYNPSSKLQASFASACEGELPKEPLEGPLEATLLFFFSRPKNHFRSGKYSHILKDGVDMWHSKRKDLDNLIKFVLDSLNEKAYLDDSQIASISSAKYYTDNEPRIEVGFRKLSNLDLPRLL